jgi:hypothetical protein
MDTVTFIINPEILGLNAHDAITEMHKKICADENKEFRMPGKLDAFIEKIGKVLQKTSVEATTIGDLLRAFDRDMFFTLHSVNGLGPNTEKTIIRMLKENGVHEDDIFSSKNAEYRKYWN